MELSEFLDIVSSSDLRLNKNRKRKKIRKTKWFKEKLDEKYKRYIVEYRTISVGVGKTVAKECLDSCPVNAVSYTHLTLPTN